MTAIARRLAELLVYPDQAAKLPAAEWPALLSVARAERLDGTLAARALASGASLPARVRVIFDDIGRDLEYEHIRAGWEIDRAEQALREVGCPVVLLKGSAYLSADLEAARGRRIGDLDILISREALGDAEAALLRAGWEWVKPDPYDDAYYRRWMHELPRSSTGSATG